MANSYLNRTPSSTGNRRKFTFSFWIKKSKNGTSETIYNVRPDSNGANRLSFHSTDTFRIAFEPISKYIFTSRKFRDTNGFYHIVVAVDTEQATAADRVKIYINGVQEGNLVKGDGGAATYPDQNADLDINTQNVINIGRDLETSSNFLNGYISHFSFVDGQQLTPTTFGSTDSTSGIWKFKPPTGVTWGTNGFHLKFENSGALGTDSSGNSNTFTVNGNLKQAIDTPSNVFNTWNNNVGSNLKPGFTYSNGNTTLAFATPASDSWGFSNLGTFSGKYYAEFKMAAFSDNTHYIGVKFFPGIEASSNFKNTIFLRFAKSSNNVAIYSGFTSAFLQENMTSLSAGDIIGIAVDIENGTVQFYKNGSTFGNQVTGQATNFSGKQLQFACFGEGSGSASGRTFTIDANFGNGFFGTTAISSEGTNASGIGKFEYDVPANHTAFCTEGFNL